MTAPRWIRGAAIGHAEPAERLERVLAVGRAFLTVTALGAIYLDPTEPARLAEVTYAVLAAYALYSLVVLACVHQARRLTAGHGIVLHGLDVLWASALTFVSEGPISPFFLFFLFVVLSAAYRWALFGTVATTAVTIVVFLVQTAIATAGPWHDTWFASFEFELNRAILRVTYLLLTGFLLGYLAQQDKRSRAEIAAIANITRQPRVDLGLGTSISAVSRDLLGTFDAERVSFVLQDYETRQTHLWHIDRAAEGAAADPPRIELDAESQAEWLHADSGRAWEATRRTSQTSVVIRAVEPGLWALRRSRFELPETIAASIPFKRMLVANLGLANEWRGRVYLFDPAAGGTSEQQLHFLAALTEQVTPALTNVFLLGRLRTRVTAAERARVARELHDGAIQALFGVEMKVEALRRGNEPLPPAAATELAEVQELLRSEVLALRELMQALRPIPLDASEQLPDVLGAIVDRFGRDTGLSARFVFDGTAVPLPPATALELVRIVQEALVNVRKHSRARNVLVRLTGQDGRCTVAIEDDGIGFAFEGQLSGDELDRRRLGPAIIKERARMAGAMLSIDSVPGSGARIELSLEIPR